MVGLCRVSLLEAISRAGAGGGARDEPPWRKVNKGRLSKFMIETVAYQMTV